MTQVAAPASPTIYQKIWNHELPSYPIYRNDELGLMAILDIHPATPGHVLIVQEEPVERVHDLPVERWQQVTFLSRLVGKHQMRTLGRESAPFPGVFGARMAHEMVYGDDVPHAHVHRVASYSRGDTSERMVSGSGRLKEVVDKEALTDMQWQLLFPAELRDYADLELSIMGEKSWLRRSVRSLLHRRRLNEGRKAFA